MNKYKKILRKISQIPSPRHLAPIPDWITVEEIEEIINLDLIEYGDLRYGLDGKISDIVFIEISRPGLELLNSKPKIPVFKILGVLIPLTALVIAILTFLRDPS